VLRIAELLIVCLAGGTGAVELSKESDGVVYSAHRSFRIPLDLSEKERQRISAVRLYASKDAGKTWTKEAEAAPDAKMLAYRTDADAVYWFSIALVDADGKQVPPNIEEVEPGLKVVVDTSKPNLLLKPIRNKSGRRGLRWEHSDDHLDASSLRLAVQDAGKEEWRPYPVSPEDKSVVWFSPDSPPAKIQAMVKDKAGNVAVLEVTLDGERFSKRAVPAFALPAETPAPLTAAEPGAPAPLALGDRSAPAPMPSVGPGSTAAAAAADPSSPPPPQPVAKIPTAVPRSMIHDPEVVQTVHTKPVVEHTAHSSPAAQEAAEPRGKFTKSRKVSINYELEQSTAPVRVELWGTRNRGEAWRCLSIDEDGKSPVVAELDADGEWGLTVVTTTAAESEAHAPKPGTEPELYIHVDTARPMVELAAHLERDAVVVSWMALDKHLSATCVDILVSTLPNGPWTPIAPKQGPKGEYVWKFAKDGVSGKAYFKAVVKDRAGNLGSAESPRELLLTSAPESPKPKAKVLGLAPTDEE
jgi:hypothetical protein